MERRRRLTEEDLIARERGQRFNGWQNVDSLKQWERETERADAEALRQQMQREASPPMQINNFLALKILIGLFLFGAALAFVLSRWQHP